MLLGSGEVPVELSLSRPVVLDDVRGWLAPRVEAVFAGRPGVETPSDSSLVSVVGTFHLDEGDVRHVYRRRLGRLLGKRSRRVTFAPYE